MMRKKSTSFLEVRGTQITYQGRPVILRGINLGGWLLMEGYLLGGPNFPENAFKNEFGRANGAAALKAFEKQFRSSFIREKDFRQIAGWGLNCVRLPFHHRLIESSPYRYDRDGLRWLDQAVKWAGKHGLWVILDLHAACGSQNPEWHSDSNGKSQLWTIPECRKRTLALWEFLAEHFKNNPTVAGYDLLNEPDGCSSDALNRFYTELIRGIRKHDLNHICFLEGLRWATDLHGLHKFDDQQYALSGHFYAPTEYTFPLIPNSTYPLQPQFLKKSGFDGKTIRKMLADMAEAGHRHNRPVLLGEFGVNDRYGHAGEPKWLDDVLAACRELKFHWTYWTYKSTKNFIFPDGIIRYLLNPEWVHRQGPLAGWQTYANLWGQHHGKIVRSWDSGQFEANDVLLAVLRKHGRSA